MASKVMVGLVVLLAVQWVAAQQSQIFAGMAKTFVPAEYAKMGPLMSIITPTVQPQDVYLIRKQILRARDMLDVFSPVYPNFYEGVDLWSVMRGCLDDGYTLIGDLQDLNHSNVPYTQADLQVKRNLVLQWQMSFNQLNQQYNFANFVGDAQLGTYTHVNESSFYWKKVPSRPTGESLGTKTLQYLLSNQLQTALKYFDTVDPVSSVITESIHAIFHDLRKELRTIMDEQNEFKTALLPVTTQYIAIFNLLGMARDKAGNINDEITAYYYYQSHHQLMKLPALQTQINSDWAAMKLWMQQVNLRGNLVQLLNDLNVPTY